MKYEKDSQDTHDNAALSSSIIELSAAPKTISLDQWKSAYQKWWQRIWPGLSENPFTYSREQRVSKKLWKSCPSLAQCRYSMDEGCCGHGWQRWFGAVDYLYLPLVCHLSSGKYHQSTDQLQAAQVANNRLNEVYPGSEFEEKKTQLRIWAWWREEWLSSRFPTSMAMARMSCRISIWLFWGSKSGFCGRF